MEKILIVCTGNTCRSPMAQVILKDILDKKSIEHEIISRGIAAETDETATENAIIACKELGLDLTQHKASRLTINDIATADKIFVMRSSHKDILISAVPEAEDKITVLNIPDPYGQSVEVYKACTKAMIKFFEEHF